MYVQCIDQGWWGLPVGAHFEVIQQDTDRTGKLWYRLKDSPEGLNWIPAKYFLERHLEQI